MAGGRGLESGPGHEVADQAVGVGVGRFGGLVGPKGVEGRPGVRLGGPRAGGRSPSRSGSKGGCPTCIGRRRGSRSYSLRALEEGSVREGRQSFFIDSIRASKSFEAAENGLVGAG